MKRAIIITCLLWMALLSRAQSSRETAREQIKGLKEGALLVRLRTSQNLINAYTSQGRLKEAEEVRIKQEQENKRIAEAFRKQYRFSKVYFFYSNHSEEVKKGNYSSYLLNTELQPDSSFTGYYLIGEFDLSETSQMSAFIIKDKNYQQLKAPFPLLIRRNKMLVDTQSEEEIATSLNYKLTEFWSKQ